MKAITQDRYGPPDVLELTDVDRPVAADDEVLVRVHAAAINAYDWHIMRGDPYVARLAGPNLGLGRPKRTIRGRDVAGRVEAVGAGVTDLAVGDEVFGDAGERDGAFAEYVALPREGVERKPANLTFEQAAALPLAGLTALKGLRDDGGVHAGQRVLVNGASGGVGTFAVQLGKALGAEVTAVCSTRNADLVRSLGADRVVDYTREDFARTGRHHDVVFDLVGNRSLGDLRRALTPDGTLVLSGGGVFKGGSLVGPMGLMIRAGVAGRFSRQQRIRILQTSPNREILASLRELAEAGKLTPAIDRTYKLTEVPDAIRYLETEHARAKVVVTVP
ncbi:MAG TPA: NAD(P)-dependent alcohol dehydrogenase [Actinophytocola sp.]|nr:NAD(P)-dependent alcohol dehydrogenase [Actinophytocola sp.]